jgi:glycerol-3-phosphate acyltransferase PlsY
MLALAPLELFGAGTFDDPSALGWRLLLSYLLGAVPFGLVMCRTLKGVDPRSVGSGNIGATNAMRILGKPLGVVAFLLDFGKGFLPAAVLGAGRVEWQVLCGAAAVCGHVWPIYLRFRGGKAVATGAGAIVGIAPMIFVGAGLAWLLLLVVTGYVSVASIGMGLAFPAMAWWLDQPASVILGTSGLTLLILVRHRSNMTKLMAGTESHAKFWLKLRGRTEEARTEPVAPQRGPDD